MNFMKLSVFSTLGIFVSINAMEHPRANTMKTPWVTRVALTELQEINKDLSPILAAADQSYQAYERCLFAQKHEQQSEKTLAELKIAAQERDEACKKNFKELQEVLMRIAKTNYLIEKNTQILSDAFLNK